jgi:preprotein translocase subunit SecA
MLKTLVRKIVGTRNDREIKRMQPIVAEINELGRGLGDLTDEQLRNKTVEFRERLDNGQELEDLLPEAPSGCAISTSR